MNMYLHNKEDFECEGNWHCNGYYCGPPLCQFGKNYFVNFEMRLENIGDLDGDDD
jgi:hypothetical protein